MKKILVAGQVCLDITPVFNEKFFGTRPSDLFIPGQLVMVDSTKFCGGGCVSNTGLTLKKLGADVAVFGKIGNDAFGHALLDLFSTYDVHGLKTDLNGITSYSFAIAIPGTDRIFLHDSGVNRTFVSSDISDDMLEDVDYFHFGYPCLMQSMFLNNGKELVSLFKRVKEKNIITSLDFSTILPESEAGKTDWFVILERVLPYVDYFVPSFEELCFMIDRTKYDTLSHSKGEITSNINLETDAKTLAEHALEMGSKHVLIKCGDAGLYYRDGKNEIIQPCYVPCEVKSAAGAGDACIGAFLATIMMGRPIKECVKYGAAEGACCVEEYDSLSGIKTLDEIDNRIASGWKTKCQ